MSRWYVVLATLLFGALLVAWAFAMPAFRAPDELQHASAALDVAEGRGWPPPGRATVDSEMLEAYGGSGEVVNQMTQHPPLYYGVGGLLLATAPDDTPAETVGWLRALGVVLSLPLPFLAWATAKRLGGTDAAAFVPAAIPQLTHIGSTANNDVLLIPLAGLVTWLAVRAATGDTSRRTAVLAGLATAAALLTKGLALALLPVLVVAWWGAPRRMLLALGAASLGLWWWVLNLLRYGVLQPAGASPSGGDAPSGLGYLRFFVEAMARRFWGVFGQLDSPLPLALVVVASLLLLAGLVLGIRRPGAAVALLPAAGLLAIVALGAWRAHATTGGTPGVQGRYLFPGVVGLSAVAAARVPWYAVVALAAIMQAAGLATV